MTAPNNVTDNLTSHYKNFYLKILGMEGTSQPSAGASGIRLIIDRPDITPDPSTHGIDISPGFTTLIGVKGKEIKRLKKPYSDCSTENIELRKLSALVAEKTNTSKDKVETWDTAYQVVDCRSACLNRLIFENCNCLDMSLMMPVTDVSLWCADIGEGGEKLYYPGDWDHCFTTEYLETDECSFLHKLFEDLTCMKKIKTKYAEEEHETGSECDCPPACDTFEYDLTISQSEWPSPGPELDAAYNKLVWEGISYEFYESDLSTDQLAYEYLTNQSNRQAIMKNFVRVVVYNQDLALELIEEVEAYGVLDLVSDIGKPLLNENA